MEKHLTVSPSKANALRADATVVATEPAAEATEAPTPPDTPTDTAEVEPEPDDGSLVQQGWLAAARGDSTAAIAALREAMERDPSDIEASISASLPAGCSATVSLLIPGRTDFVLLEDEQKFVLYRGNIECHTPATEQVLPISITVEIDHQLHLIGNDGDDNNPANDSVTVNQNIIIGPPAPQ